MMLATIGFRSTPLAVSINPRIDAVRLRAHSTDTVTSVHSRNELNTSTSDTAGSAASPSSVLASGTPRSRLFEKMPPTPNTDCAAPSMPNSRRAATRARPNTSSDPPK